MINQEQKTKKDIYDQEYKKANYDQIAIRVRKGKKDEYQQAADEFGLGQAEMIRLAIEYFISERRLQEFKPFSVNKPESISANERKLLDAFAKCPEHVKPAIRKILEELATKGGGEND